MPDQEQTIVMYVKENGTCTTAKVGELLEVKDRRARAILETLVKKQILKKQGKARNTIYLAGEQFPA
jgi:predicted HTH transcriptional regulator